MLLICKYQGMQMFTRGPNSNQLFDFLMTKLQFSTMATNTGFTEEQIHDFHEAFLCYDRCNDGLVSIKDLGKLMKACGENPSAEELHKIYNETWACGKKKIDFNDFLQIIAERYSIDPEEDIREAFHVFDMKGNGFIKAEELKDVLTTVGVLDEHVDEFLYDMDMNKDGKINYYEFLRVMKLADDTMASAN